MRNYIQLLLILSILAMLACSKPTDQPPSSNSQSNRNTAVASAKKTTATGTITANPNPIKVCDGTGAGVTNLSWSASGPYLIEVRIGAPDGSLFAQTVASEGGKPTGKWLGDGTVVYLQDVSNGNPLTAEYTIATVRIHVTTEGCP